MVVTLMSADMSQIVGLVSNAFIIYVSHTFFASDRVLISCLFSMFQLGSLLLLFSYISKFYFPWKGFLSHKYSQVTWVTSYCWIRMSVHRNAFE